MTEQLWLWIGFAGMSAGAASIFLLGGRRTPAEETATILHGTVPVIAACAYLAMALGQGTFTGTLVRHVGGPGGAEYPFYFVRYVDWLFTTPLLLLALGLTAMHGGVRRPGLLAGVIGADVLMIVAAFLFGATDAQTPKWIWFGVSCGAFAAVGYVLAFGLREEAGRQREEVRAAWTMHALVLSALWLAYPVVLLLDPEGLNLINSATSVAIFTVLDLSSKVAYGLMAGASHARFAAQDLRGHEAAAAMARRLG